MGAFYLNCIPVKFFKIMQNECFYDKTHQRTSIMMIWHMIVAEEKQMDEI